MDYEAMGFNEADLKEIGLEMTDNDLGSLNIDSDTEAFDSKEETDEETLNLELLEEHAKFMAQEIVQLKRAGKIDEAKSLLKEYKSVKEEIKLLTSNEEETPEEEETPPEEEESAESLKKRIDKMLVQALTAKRSGNMELARSILLQVKSLKAQLATAVEEDTQTSNSAESTEKEAKRAKIFSILLKRLEAQAIELRTCAKVALSMKTDSSREKAKEFLQIEKQMKRAIAFTEEARHTNAAIPEYSLQNISLLKELRFDEIPSPGFQLTVIDGSKFKISKHEKITTYVYMKYEYENNGEQTFQSSPLADHDASPVYNVETHFKLPELQVIRKKHRSFKYNKVKISVYIPRFLGIDKKFGEGEFKIGGLMDKAETTDMVTIKNEKKVVGKLKVRARIAHPINSRDIRPFQASYYFVSVPEPKQESQSAYEESQSPPEKAALGSEVKIPVSSDSQSCPAGIRSEDWENPHRVELLVGNEVFEHEINVISTSIATYRVKKEAVPDELIARFHAVKLKMDTLVASVQSEELSLEEYVLDLKKNAAYLKKLYQSLNEAGRASESAYVLGNLKLMAGEIKGASG